MASLSLYRGSEEEVTLECDVCKYRGLTSPAITYCQVCTEALCQVCDNVHRAAKQTRNHKLLSGDQLLAVPSDSGRIPSEMMCDKHQLPFEYFCKKDNVVICNSCKISSHRPCDVSDITTQVVRTKVGQMYGKVKDQIKKYEIKCRQLKKKRTDDKIMVKTQIQKCLDDLAKSRKEINDVLDDLEKNMKLEIKHLEEKLTKEVGDHLVLTGDTLDMILNSTKLMEENEIGKKDDVMFVTMKKVEENLREFESVTTGLEAAIKDIDIRFEPSDLLTTELLHLNKFGNIIHQTSFLEMSINKGTTRKTGCQRVQSIIFMPDGNIVLACASDGLRLFDRDFNLQSTMKIRAIKACRMSDTEVLVSEGSHEKITMVKISKEMVMKKEISVNRPCSGIDFFNNEIYITCDNNPGNGEVRVLDLDGQIQRRLGYDGKNYMFEGPYNVKVSQNGGKVVVSDSIKACVFCLDQQGRVIYRYTDVDLLEPCGILLDEYDNFLVCDGRSNTIHAVSQDGQKHKILLRKEDVINRPVCISYRDSDGCLAVGLYDGTKSSTASLLTFTMKK